MRSTQVSPEIAEARRLTSWTVEQVINASCAVHGVERRTLLRGMRGRRNMPRMLCLLACRDLTPSTLHELAKRFGVSSGAVSALASRVGSKMKEDDELARAYLEIKKHLNEQ